MVSKYEELVSKTSYIHFGETEKNARNCYNTHALLLLINFAFWLCIMMY